MRLATAAATTEARDGLAVEGGERVLILGQGRYEAWNLEIGRWAERD